MSRRIESKRLVLATHNPKKLEEFRALFKSYDIEVVSAGALNLPEPEEIGATFEENAILKAHAAAEATGEIALADDSGLCVKGLNGDPGIYSARWAVQEDGSKDFKIAMQKVNEGIGDNADRSAAFVAVLSLVWPNGHSEIFRAECKGTLIWPPRGDYDFGYDPMFCPGDEPQTFGENPALKDKYSHRHLAFEKLAEACLLKKR